LGHKQTIVQFFHAKDFKQHFVSHFSLKVFSIDVNISGKHQQQGCLFVSKATITGSSFAACCLDESPVWICSHLLAMIQACTHHSAIILKSQSVAHTKQINHNLSRINRK